jgi:hypothetical protein
MNNYASVVGSSQIATGTTFLQNTNYNIPTDGAYLIIFNSSSQIPKDMIVTYMLFCNDNPIPGAVAQTTSPIDHSKSIIFPTSFSIIANFKEGDKISVQVEIVSGVMSDSIVIKNTILNIIKMF